MNKGSLFNQSILDAVLQHQEQFDGNGYPRKLKGDKVGLFAKILAVADTFEAQISPRAYRKSKSGYMAMKSVLAEAKNKFDPDVLRSFLTTLSIYPPGTVLQLNNNSIGSVISVNPNAPLRPVVKIIVDEFGEKIDENVIKDLKEEQDLFIVRVLNKEEYKK
jgi:HD-GYP domain-containing protein (c-di-GMP phosphodiesterase class II)